MEGNDVMLAVWAVLLNY